MHLPFGLAPTPRSQGFFAVAELHETIAFREQGFATHDGRLVLGSFVLHGWRALYACDGAPPVNGAVRIREWRADRHWLRFRWPPDLERGDAIMPELPRDESDLRSTT